MTDITEALDALLKSSGWQLFRAHYDAEWGPRGTRYTSELEKALDLADPALAASQARQIVSARKAIEQLMVWPSEELARLLRQQRPAEPVGSRRGGL